MLPPPPRFADLGRALLRYRMERPGGETAVVEGMLTIAELLTLDQALLGGMPASQTVVRLMRALAWATGATTGRLFYAAPGGQGFLCFDNKGAIVAHLCLPMITGLTGAALTTNRTSLWTNIAAERGYDPTIDDVGEALALVPMLRVGEPIGVVQLGGPAFDASVAAILDLAAPVISEALATATPQYAVVIEEATSHARDSTGQLDQLAGLVLANATELIEADRAAVFLYDRSTDDLVSRINQGFGAFVLRQSARAGVEGTVFAKVSPLRSRMPTKTSASIRCWIGGPTTAPVRYWRCRLMAAWACAMAW